MLSPLNKSFRSSVLILTFITPCFLSGCGGSDPEPVDSTEMEKVTGLLTAGGGTWAPASSAGVTIDGTDVTEALFSGFTITFHDKTFTTTGATPVWLREDTWKFKDASATVIIRGGDQKEVTINEISATQLKLTLDWSLTTHEGGRQGSLKGKHEFVLTK